jgi:hypothetical protein
MPMRLIATALTLAGSLPVFAGVLHDFELPEPPRQVEPKSMAQVLERYAPRIDESIRPRLENLGLNYPPERLTLIALKEERLLEIWAYQEDRPYLVHSYPVKDASGLPGPKRRRGDFQVPEGIYRINAFNPNSSFHFTNEINDQQTFSASEPASGKARERRHSRSISSERNAAGGRL